MRCCMLLGLSVLISGCAALAKLEPRPVNINEASRARLEMLPGISPATAQRIIEGRPHRSIKGLRNIKGINSEVLERIRPLITLGPERDKAGKPGLDRGVDSGKVRTPESAPTTRSALKQPSVRKADL